MIEKCQVFTPEKNVNELLDYLEYTDNLYGKKIIENACGDGNILIEITKRYIEDCLKQNLNYCQIKLGLERDICGAELDERHYQRCLEKLDFLAKKYGIVGVRWNILNDDFLKQKFEKEFDFVIGNPPYIMYRELDFDTRLFLKNTFRSCKTGKFDYCYAFVEASISCLKDSGKLAYLIPSSIFKNVFAEELRGIIRPFVSKIIDYSSQKLFENVLTSSSILICDKANVLPHLEYYDVVGEEMSIISRAELSGKWVFNHRSNNQQRNEERRFGDYFTASISIATLLNEAYVLKNFEVSDRYILVDNFKIEIDVIRKGVSPRALNYKKNELILFPYAYEKQILKRYETREFEDSFPEATIYLRTFLTKLVKRKADRSTRWFEYGRTQALAHLNQSKLLLSTVVTNEVKVYSLSKDCIPYSGIYIVPKSDMPLSKGKEILESDQFYRYIQGIGINASGHSKRITPADICNYKF